MKELNSQMFLKVFGEKLRELRKTKGLTLDDVSINSGIDTSDIGKIERGEINFAFSTFCKLSIGLKCKLTDLVNFDIEHP